MLMDTTQEAPDLLLITLGGIDHVYVLDVSTAPPAFAVVCQTSESFDWCGLGGRVLRGSCGGMSHGKIGSRGERTP